MVRLPPVLPHQALDFDAALFRARAAERLVFLPDIVTFDCCDFVGGGRDRSLLVRISSDAAGVVPMRSMSQGSGSGCTCSAIEQRSTGCDFFVACYCEILIGTSMQHCSGLLCGFLPSTAGYGKSKRIFCDNLFGTWKLCCGREQLFS